MQVVPLNEMNEIDFTQDDDEEKQDFAILPNNIKPRMIETCGTSVATAVAMSYKNIQKFLLPE